MNEKRETKKTTDQEKKQIKKRRRTKNSVYNKESGIMVGERKLLKIGGGYYLNVPREFIEDHGIKVGDVIPFISKYTLKYVPIKKDGEWGDF